METPKPKPRRKRGCAREGRKRRPHELNRNAFALPPTRPVQHAAPLRRHQGRSSSPATSLRLVRGLQGCSESGACVPARPYLGPRRYPVT